MPVDLVCDRRCRIRKSAFFREDFLTSLLVKDVKGKTQKGEAGSSGETTCHSLPQTNGGVKKDGNRHMRDSSIGSLNARNLVGSFMLEQLLNRDYLKNADVHTNNPCYSETHSTNIRVVANCSEEWLNNLHIVTLKHNKNFQFSICDNIFQPIELIFVGYLLSSLEPSSSAVEADIDTDITNLTNQRTSSQINLKQRIEKYTQECVKKVQLTVPVADMKAQVDTGEIKTSIQLEVLIRHIFLQYPEEAYDAVLVLCDMEQEISLSSKHDSSEKNKKENKNEILQDICLCVVYSLSISAACSNEVHECKVSEKQKEDENENENENEKDLSREYKIQLQDSLLKVLLHFNDALGAAQFLKKWNRINDLRTLSKRAWESVRFLLGEEENEEYSPFCYSRSRSTSSSTWRNVPLRRPLPEFENINELINSDEFGEEDDEEDDDEDEEVEEDDDEDNEDNDTMIALNRNQIIFNENMSLTQETALKPHLKDSSSENLLGPIQINLTRPISNYTGPAVDNFNDTGGTLNQRYYPGVLPPNSSKRLKARLLEAFMIKQLYPQPP